MKRNVLVWLMGAGLVAAAGPALAGGGPDAAVSWPQWQGPNRDNRSPDTGLHTEWPAEGPTLLWKATGLGGKGYSTVAIADGMIYTTGIGADQKDLISAFDLSGQVKWRVPNGGGFLQSHGGTRATPTINDGLLYVLSGLGRLACFDARTGAEKWAVEITTTFGGKVPRWGYAESVLVDGDKVFVTPGGSKAVAALDKKTGATIWTTTGFSDGASYCAPIVFDLGGVRQVCTMTAGNVLGIEASTGKVLWRFPKKTAYDVHATTPIYKDGSVYVTSGYGTFGMRLDLTAAGGKFEVKEAWKDPNLDNHHGGVVLVGGFIYGYGDRGGWTCLELATGAVKWKSKALAKGSITYADGMLYCYTEDNGTVALVKATPGAFEKVSAFRVPSGSGGPYWAHPVVVGGRLYVRHSDVLYCYDLKASAAGPPG